MVYCQNMLFNKALKLLSNKNAIFFRKILNSFFRIADTKRNSTRKIMQADRIHS
jgi:hypothetical protein